MYMFPVFFQNKILIKTKDFTCFVIDQTFLLYLHCTFTYAIFIHVQILGDSGGPLVVKNMDNCNTAVLLGVVRYRFLPIIINLKLNLYNINTKIKMKLNPKNNQNS